MLRHWIALAMAAALIAGGGCSRQRQSSDPEEFYSQLRDQYAELETPEEKTTLAEEYLARFPDTAHSGSMARTVAYYRGEEMADPEGAFEIISTVLDKIADPDARFEVGMVLLPLSHEIGRPIDLGQVADALAAHRSLGFSDHLAIMEAAAEHGLWTIAEEHAAAGLPLATEEAYRSDHPDAEMADGEVARAARRRRVLALAHRGWALVNQDRADEGLALFSEAEPLSTVNYLGVPDTPLKRFWGRTVLARGDVDLALELLAPDAVLGDSAEALSLLRQAFVVARGNEGGFDDYLWSIREALARPIDDVSLFDYEGEPITLSSLRRDKVTLLAFWFPT